MDNQKKQTLARILEIQRELDLRKALYDELDQKIMELQAGGFMSAELDGFRMELVDNFAAGNNTCFRPAGVKRFEVKIETLEAYLKRQAKKEKKKGAS